MHKIQINFFTDKREFAPGDELQGDVVWDLAKTAERIELRLFWVTSGKGIPESGVVEAIRFDRPMAQDSQRFQFHLPQFPFSYEGRLMRLTWAVEAICTPGNQSTREEFVLAPSRKKIFLPLPGVIAAKGLVPISPELKSAA